MDYSSAPWTSDENGIRDRLGRTIMSNVLSSDFELVVPDENDARRIVLCVNACENIPTKILLQLEHDTRTKEYRRRKKERIVPVENVPPINPGDCVVMTWTGSKWDFVKKCEEKK